MLINYFVIVLIGFLAGMVFVFLFRKFALRYRVLSPQGIPLIGGIAMGLSFALVSLLGSFLYRSLPTEVIGIIISATIMLVFGIIDDWKELSIDAKFLVQIIATSLLIFFGIRTRIVYIGGLSNLIITYIWILAITNTFNHLDIIDGLSAGCAMIISLAFFIVAFLNGDTKIAILSLAATGAILSCFIYNFPPAKIYMGNSGSHFLGFILAAIALSISYASIERKVALLSPLLILGFPIFDTAFLILMRVRRGRSIFKKSNDHLALRFLRSGYSKNKTLLFMLILALFFSLSGIVVSQAPNTLGIIITGLVIIIALTLTKRMSRITLDG